MLFQSGESCIELIPAIVEQHYGYAVARGIISTDDIEKELMQDVPTEEGVRHLLGDELYKDYLREKRQNNVLGPMHARVREGQAKIVRAYNFRQAYNATEFDWCLRHHQQVSSFRVHVIHF